MQGLPEGVVSRTLPVSDLDLHFLEAKPQPSTENPRLVLLLHGFPELAYTWRKVMVPLAKEGYHVVAPDQRGYGATAVRGAPSRPIQYEDDLRPFRLLNLVKDIVALVYALGYTSVALVVGHDAGSRVAGFCALVRPDLFKGFVCMSAPFTGAPALPFNIDDPASAPSHAPDITLLAPQVDEALAALDPPRKHYVSYYTSPVANRDLLGAPQGLHDFLRAYFHMKSADWERNKAAKPLPARTAEALAVMPEYYIMPFNKSMPEVVAKEAPSVEVVSSVSSRWLPDSDLVYYVCEFSRTGFQGGLNWYRVVRSQELSEDLLVFSNKKIEVPAMYLSGKQDWGVYQNPGAIDKMKKDLCERMEDEDFILVDGAGHWVQQERPHEVAQNLLRFLRKIVP